MTRHDVIRFRMLRNGIEYGELYAGNSSPTLRCDSSGELKMSMQGSFLPTVRDRDGKEVEADWLNDEIEPVLVMDGTEEPLGVLMPAKVTPKRQKDVEVLEIQAYDRCWRVRDMKVEGSIYLAAGTAYLTAVEGLLGAAGIANISITPSDATLTEDRQDWETGTSYLEIINQLLGEINYKPLWFNQSGIAMLEPVRTPTAQNIQHIFTNQKRDPRNRKETEAIQIHPTISRETDLYEAPNVFVCICSNADKEEPMRASAVNDNPQSPLSTVKRGRRIVKVVNVNNIASQEALEAYANRLLYESMTTGEIINIVTPLLPGFGVEDVSAISTKDVMGICVEKSWTMNLTIGGKMTHELEKVVINLG